MSVVFKPTGTLNVAYDPSDLPGSNDERSEVSAAMQRCKNLRLDQDGVIKSRDGSERISATQLALLGGVVVQSGARYEFTGSTIYRNEAQIWP